MCFIQLIFPVEPAHRAVSYLGDLGLVQFKDGRDLSPPSPPLPLRSAPHGRAFDPSIHPFNTPSSSSRNFVGPLSRPMNRGGEGGPHIWRQSPTFPRHARESNTPSNTSQAQTVMDPTSPPNLSLHFPFLKTSPFLPFLPLLPPTPSSPSSLSLRPSPGEQRREEHYITAMAFRGGSAAPESNLQCFLTRTTPVVPLQQLPKACFRDSNRLWQPWDSETVEFFTLQDVWSCYDEWSAYGAGIPVLMGEKETLIQYYVPYLSAIQIYTSSAFIANSRYFREDADMSDLEVREFSDSCSLDSESDKLWRSDAGSSEDCGFDQEGIWHFNDRIGHLNFEYFERSAPYRRAPLSGKIRKLAEGYPGLMTLKSVDLSPASWMAVAWYPIYHIPKGRTVKDLSACFLTYHTLSSLFQDSSMFENGSQEEIGCTDKRLRSTNDIALPPFGLATYKMQGSLWVSGDNGRDHERMLSFLTAADSWLKQLGVQHHDFSYFTGIRR